MSASIFNVRKLGIILRVIIPVLILFIGVQVMLGLKATRPQPERRDNEEQVRDVRVQMVKVAPARLRLTGYGTLRSARMIQVSPEVGGRVVHARKTLEDGDIVEAGDVLIRIDDTDYSAVLAAREAERERLIAELALLKQQMMDTRVLLKVRESSAAISQKELERQKTLLNKQSVGSEAAVDAVEIRELSARERVLATRQDLERIPLQERALEASLKQLDAQIKMAREDLNRCAVRAPISGRLADVKVEVGQLVNRNQVMMEVIDDSLLEIAIPLKTSDVMKNMVFGKAPISAVNGWFVLPEKVSCSLIWVDGPGQKAVPAQVSRIRRVDERTRTTEVVVVPEPGTPHSLVTGSFCKVEVPGIQLEEVMSIPRGALTNQGDTLVMVEGRLHTRQVSLLQYQGDQALLGVPSEPDKNDLRPGDQLIVTPIMTPVDGQKVRVIENTFH